MRADHGQATGQRLHLRPGNPFLLRRENKGRAGAQQLGHFRMGQAWVLGVGPGSLGSLLPEIMLVASHADQFRLWQAPLDDRKSGEKILVALAQTDRAD